MNLNKYFKKLKDNTLVFNEYKSLRRQCLRLVRKACRRYKMNDILLNKALEEDVLDHIYVKSLLKTLKTYDKEKSSFTTYFYYKACSAARNEVGKLKRRIKVNNTYSLDETFYTGEK